jgi:hypothetical protein
LLNNALAQTNWVGEIVTQANWRDLIKARFLEVNWQSVVNDGKPFIEPNFDLTLLNKENLEKILNK